MRDIADDMEQLTVSGSTLDPDPELVASEPRRLTLRYPMESSDRASGDDLADYLREHSSTDHRAGHEAMLTEFHHRQFPKLEARGLVDHDPRSGAVRYHPDDRIERVLECLPGG